jgi:GTP-binding protein
MAVSFAIVGRPNVGKSTLFNRLVGYRKAVVSSTAGTTRDRVMGQLSWKGVPVTLTDTGGVDFTATDPLGEAVQRHIARAIEDADGFVFVCDVHVGLLPADLMVFDRLRTMGKPVVVAVNKADDRAAVPVDFHALGVEEILPISALHGRGVHELLDRLVAMTPKPLQADSAVLGVGRDLLHAAIIGRQNVGKSSFFNAVLREERVIVSDVPGTTRDAIDTELVVDGKRLVLIDTAGLRHKRKVKTPLDVFAMSRSLEAIDRCGVALLVFDATLGITADDRRIAARVVKVGKGLVLLGNKWDLVKAGHERKLAEGVRRALPHASFAPVVALSAKTGLHVRQSLELAHRIFRAMQQGLSEEQCTRLVGAAWMAHPPPRARGRPIKLKSATYRLGTPARLELVTSPCLGELPKAYAHYLVNRLHADPRLSGVPITIATQQPISRRRLCCWRWRRAI